MGKLLEIVGFFGLYFLGLLIVFIMGIITYKIGRYIVMKLLPGLKDVKH